MFIIILAVIGVIIATIAIVMLIEKVLPRKAKPFIVAIFFIISIFFGYKIYQSINEPIEFKKVKRARFADVIDNLKDVRDSQIAYKTVTGKYANDFPSLVKFIDTAQFTIIERRDTSYMEYNKTYRIDMLKEEVITDTLGYVGVKDSLFKSSDRYKEMMFVPHAQSKEKFTMKADILDKNGFKVPVFEAKVKKDVVLYDQPDDLRSQENELISIDGVNGSEIIVGSLTEVSTNGNWPPLYDAKDKQ